MLTGLVPCAIRAKIYVDVFARLRVSTAISALLLKREVRRITQDMKGRASFHTRTSTEKEDEERVRAVPRTTYWRPGVRRFSPLQGCHTLCLRSALIQSSAFQISSSVYRHRLSDPIAQDANTPSTHHHRSAPPVPSPALLGCEVRLSGAPSARSPPLSISELTRR